MSAPVFNVNTINIVSILMIIAGWWAGILDVKEELLTGIFDKGEELYMEVTQGMYKY